MYAVLIILFVMSTHTYLVMRMRKMNGKNLRLFTIPWRFASCTRLFKIPLQWHANGHNGVSNHQCFDCLLSRLFRPRSKKTSKLRVTGLCAGNSPETGEFPAQGASNAENVSIWRRDHTRRFASCMRLFKIPWRCASCTSQKEVRWGCGIDFTKLVCPSLH